MKIDLVEDECLMIERLLEDAALNTVDYTCQGKFIDLKEFFHAEIVEHEKNEKMQIKEINKMKKMIRSN